MRLATRIAIVVPMLLIASCEAYSWPPYEKRLRSMFLESKSVLTEIEAEMIADGLVYMGPGPAMFRSDQPEPTQDQVDKYGELFERLSYRWKLWRNDGATYVRIDGQSPRGMGRDFSYTLAHLEEPANLPACDAGGWIVSCGLCTVDLGDDWSIQYSWYPKNIGPEWDGRLGEGLPTMEEIQEQRRQELDACLDAGMKKMGVTSGIE